MTCCSKHIKEGNSIASLRLQFVGLHRFVVSWIVFSSDVGHVLDWEFPRSSVEGTFTIVLQIRFNQEMHDFEDGC